MVKEKWVDSQRRYKTEYEESEKNEDESGIADKTTYTYDSLFKKLPSSS